MSTVSPDMSGVITAPASRGRFVFCLRFLRTQMRTIRKTKRMIARMGPTIQTIEAFFGLGFPRGSPPLSGPFGRGLDGGGPGGSCKKIGKFISI
jgi:hypothetical protein